jgi:hypothetical protein
MIIPFDLFTEVIKYIDKDQLSTIRLVSKKARNHVDSTLECGVIVHGLKKYNATEIVIKWSSDTQISAILKDTLHKSTNPFIISDSKSSINVYFSKEKSYTLFNHLLLFSEILTAQNIKYKYVSWSSEVYKDFMNI